MDGDFYLELIITALCEILGVSEDRAEEIIHKLADCGLEDEDCIQTLLTFLAEQSLAGKIKPLSTKFDENEGTLFKKGIEAISKITFTSKAKIREVFNQILELDIMTKEELLKLFKFAIEKSKIRFML